MLGHLQQSWCSSPLEPERYGDGHFSADHENTLRALIDCGGLNVAGSPASISRQADRTQVSTAYALIFTFQVYRAWICQAKTTTQDDGIPQLPATANLQQYSVEGDQHPVLHLSWNTYRRTPNASNGLPTKTDSTQRMRHFWQACRQLAPHQVYAHSYPLQIRLR